MKYEDMTTGNFSWLIFLHYEERKLLLNFLRDNRENRATRKMETEYIIGRRASRDFVKFRTKYPLLSSDNNFNSLVIYRETLATALPVITAITRKLRCFLVSLRILLKEILPKKHSSGLLERSVTFVKRQSAQENSLCTYFFFSLIFFVRFKFILTNTKWFLNVF